MVFLALFVVTTEYVDSYSDRGLCRGATFKEGKKVTRWTAIVGLETELTVEKSYFGKLLEAPIELPNSIKEL
jgi:hypothetical protein